MTPDFDPYAAFDFVEPVFLTQELTWTATLTYWDRDRHNCFYFRVQVYSADSRTSSVLKDVSVAELTPMDRSWRGVDAARAVVRTRLGWAIAEELGLSG